MSNKATIEQISARAHDMNLLAVMLRAWLDHDAVTFARCSQEVERRIAEADALEKHDYERLDDLAEAR